MEAVDEAAKTNFCVRSVPLADIEPFDLGGQNRVNEIIQKAGYRKAEDDDTVTMDYWLTKNWVEACNFPPSGLQT